MNTRADICVVGGGIIGLAVAFDIAGRGRRVTVLEAEGLGQRAAAWVAAGMLAPAAEADIADPRLTPLALASHSAYPGWIEELEAISGVESGFDRTGTLFVALDRDHIALLERLELFQHERGLRAERLGAAALLELEPRLSPGVVGGLRLADDWQVDPRRLLEALARGLAARGAELREDAPVERIEVRGDRVVVQFRRGEEPSWLDAGAVVLASGAWSFGAWSSSIEAPVAPLPMRPVKGQVVRLSGAPVVRHVVRTPDVYLVPRRSGELVVGATMELQGFDARVRAGAIWELLRDARRALPGIDELAVSECPVGFRPALRDHLPAIGAMGERIFVATGHFRSGVELAPITARLLADLVCDGRADPLLEAYSPSRFGAMEARGPGR